MKYAIIKTGAKQYRVSEGDVLSVEKLAHDGKTVTFSEVLLLVDGETVQIGKPLVPGTSVTASVVGDVKGDKLAVFKYKSKSRYRRLRGHRQNYTRVKIETIGAAPKAEPKKAPAAKTPAKPAKSEPKKASAAKPARKSAAPKAKKA